MISPWRWLHRNDYLYFSRSSNESNGLVDYGIVYYSIYYLYIVIIIYIQRLNYPVSIFLSNYLGTDKDAWEVKNSLLFSSCETNSLCRAMLSFFFQIVSSDLKKLGFAIDAAKRKGKVEKSWRSKNVNRVDSKERWNVAITRWDYANGSVSCAKSMPIPILVQSITDMLSERRRL